VQTSDYLLSIGHDPKGKRRILFCAGDGSRKTIRLGKCSERAAETVLMHVEELVSVSLAGHAINRNTAVWLDEISDVLHERLVKVGLIKPRGKVPGMTLGAFTADYIESRRIDTKPRTIINLTQTRKELLRYFGEDKPMVEVTSGDAIAFRLAMLGRKLADNTVRRHLGRCRQFYKAAIDKELLQKNPFAHKQIKVAVRGNPDRRYFIGREVIERVLAACSDDTEWQTIIALARYGGLRCPSEVLALRWTDIDWESNMITVRCPKLEHLEGHETRVIPLFRELKPVLRQAFAESPTGSEFVISRYRGGNKNLRTQFLRIIRRAGVEPWGMPFQNLRSSRETELNETYPWYTVCTWMGHSREVASERCLTVPAEHYARAAAGEAAPPGSAAQNPAQYMHAGARKGSHDQGHEEGKTAFCGSIQGVAAPCEPTEPQPIPPRGVEPLSPG